MAKVIEEPSELVEQYIFDISEEFETKISSWKIDMDEEEKFTVTSGLLCRQVMLCSSMASEPGFWNADLGFMIIRLMSSVLIDLAWIACAPYERSKQFILYGVGQGLVDIEHKRLFVEKGEMDDSALKAAEHWLTGQRKEMFIEVDLASWSGLSVSKMAEEAGCLNIYEELYSQTSMPLHSNWYHISWAHFRSKVDGIMPPVCPTYPVEIQVLFVAARLMHATFEVAEKIYQTDGGVKNSSFEKLIAAWDDYNG